VAVGGIRRAAQWPSRLCVPSPNHRGSMLKQRFCSSAFGQRFCSSAFGQRLLSLFGQRFCSSAFRQRSIYSSTGLPGGWQQTHRARTHHHLMWLWVAYAELPSGQAGSVSHHQTTEVLCIRAEAMFSNPAEVPQFIQAEVPQFVQAEAIFCIPAEVHVLSSRVPPLPPR
jgi:hypothetical protein